MSWKNSSYCTAGERDAPVPFFARKNMSLYYAALRSANVLFSAFLVPDNSLFPISPKSLPAPRSNKYIFKLLPSSLLSNPPLFPKAFASRPSSHAADRPVKMLVKKQAILAPFDLAASELAAPNFLESYSRLQNCDLPQEKKRRQTFPSTANAVRRGCAASTTSVGSVQEFRRSTPWAGFCFEFASSLRPIITKR